MSLFQFVQEAQSPFMSIQDNVFNRSISPESCNNINTHTKNEIHRNKSFIEKKPPCNSTTEHNIQSYCFLCITCPSEIFHCYLMINTDIGTEQIFFNSIFQKSIKNSHKKVI